MKSNSVKCQNWQYKIVQSDALYKRGSVIENDSLTTLGDFFSERCVKRLINIINPTIGNLGPLLYYCFLLRAKLAFSLELAESFFNICI